MAVETIDLAKVTAESAISINALRDSISRLKEELGKMKIGSDEYRATLEQLENHQAALKNAMHGTAADMTQIAAAARGADESYNGLVRTMAKYKEELRAIDTSTEAGKDAFKKKATQINEVNDKLKKLDAMQGNYQRNVGNYKSAVEGLGTAFTTMGGAAALCVNPIQSLVVGFKTLSATPALAVLGLLAAAINGVALGIKSSEENTNAWNRALSAFKPIGDSFMRTMQQVGEVAADVANKFVDLLEQWGLLGDAARQRMGIEETNQYLRQLQRNINIENATLEEEISDLRAKAAERDKYTAKQREEMLEQAKVWQMRIEDNNRKMLEERLRVAKEEADLARNDAETNDKINQLEVALIEQRVKRNTTLRRLNREISSSRREQAREAKNTAAEEVETEKVKLATWQDLQKKMTEAEKRRAQEAAELDAFAQDLYATQTAEVQAQLDAQIEAEYDAMMAERRIQQQRIATFTAFGGALADIAGSIADIYEADAEADEQAAKKAKQLRTAGAIISTLSGAVSAFTSTWSAAELPYTAKMILAPLNAAAVIAAGMAQVKQINAVKVGSGTGDAAPAMAAAPTFAPAISMTRSVTGRSETERLNKMAEDSRVYLVYSDLEIANTRQRVRVKETEF